MAKAIAKYVRMSPRKVRRVVNVIRGKDTTSALKILKFMPYSAAKVVAKVLKSAIANAKENENLNVDDLKITKAFVDQAVTLKRWRPMSRGRAYPRLKRSSHITIEVLDPNNVENSKELKLEKPKAVKKDKHEHNHENCDHDHEHKHNHENRDHDHSESSEGKKKKEVKGKSSKKGKK